MSIIGISLSIPTHQPSRHLSLLSVLIDSRISSLSIAIPSQNLSSQAATIRMGGGPRTFPGGVSKWQWKRMQAKKAKQLLKARLCRERQIYEMRKRAELRAAVSELERPWELVERAPNLFSVQADDQLKALADRFQRPGGYDLWSDYDGPQVFGTQDGLLPSARFFPRGVVHSVKPYGVLPAPSDSETSDEEEILQRGNGSGISRSFSNRTRRRVCKTEHLGSQRNDLVTEGLSDSMVSNSTGKPMEGKMEVLLGGNAGKQRRRASYVMEMLERGNGSGRSRSFSNQKSRGVGKIEHLGWKRNDVVTEGLKDSRGSNSRGETMEEKVGMFGGNDAQKGRRVSYEMEMLERGNGSGRGRKFSNGRSRGAGKIEHLGSNRDLVAKGLRGLMVSNSRGETMERKVLGGDDAKKGRRYDFQHRRGLPEMSSERDNHLDGYGGRGKKGLSNGRFRNNGN